VTKGTKRRKARQDPVFKGHRIFMELTVNGFVQDVRNRKNAAWNAEFKTILKRRPL